MVVMYIDAVPNRNSPPAVLLRESYREGGKVKKRTLANLSALPPEAIEAVKATLQGETLVPVERAFEIVEARPHGAVAAVVGTMHRLGLPELLVSRPRRERDLVLAMIAARIVEPCSKLATARQLGGDTLSSSLGEVLGVGDANADDLYDALDWLRGQQRRIEPKLARRHLEQGQLVLWDVTTVAFESLTCPLAVYGRPKKGVSERQVLFGLLMTHKGIPVAVEVFPGNTGDPATVATVLERVQEDFHLEHVVVVGDRGMLTDARIEEDLRPRKLDWITSLRAPTIRKLWESGPLQLSLFDEQDLAEITSPDFPGERLIACKNPLLAQERARKRRELLEATEAMLQAIVDATHRAKRALRGKDKIGVRVGRVLARSKVGKHFRYQITEDGFTFERDEVSIADEAALDGIYVLRTSVTPEQLEREDVVRAYKRLSEVEQAFRLSKDFALEVEPIRHRREDRVRAHIFLCMLALYVRIHMEQALAPILFTDHDPDGAGARPASVVAPATLSDAAKRKKGTKTTADGLPVQSFRSLLASLGTLTKNTVRIDGSDITFVKYARPTPLQEKAFELLDVSFRV
jgi:hypothetical protein